MSEMNTIIVPDEELIEKAKIKLGKMGVDLNTAFNKFLQRIVEDEIDEPLEMPITCGETNKEQLLKCAGLFDDETTLEILNAIEDCKKINLETWE